MPLEQEIEAYLTTNKNTAVTQFIGQLEQSTQLLLFGETHVGLDQKSRFFASLIREARRSGRIKFFASEHFNSRIHGNEIGRFLSGQLQVTQLSSRLRLFSALLEEIRQSLPSFGIVFCGTTQHSNRDRLLYDNFTAGRGAHISARRFTDRDHGHFHLGAFHAGRVANSGSTVTTCAYLIRGGMSLAVIRMTIDIETTSSPSEEGGIASDIGESISVQPRGGGSALNLLPVLRRVANGAPFIANLCAQRSPFGTVCPEGGTAVFNTMYDYLLHLPR